MASSATLNEDPIKKGCLAVQLPGEKTYQDYYLILKPSSLDFYEDLREADSSNGLRKRQVLLKNCIIIQAQKRNSVKYGFSMLLVPEGLYLMSATSDTEKNTWLKTIRQTISDQARKGREHDSHQKRLSNLVKSPKFSSRLKLGKNKRKSSDESTDKEVSETPLPNHKKDTTEEKKITKGLDPISSQDPVNGTNSVKNNSQKIEKLNETQNRGSERIFDADDSMSLARTVSITSSRMPNMNNRSQTNMKLIQQSRPSESYEQRTSSRPSLVSVQPRVETVEIISVHGPSNSSNSSPANSHGSTTGERSITINSRPSRISNTERLERRGLPSSRIRDLNEQDKVYNRTMRQQHGIFSPPLQHRQSAFDTRLADFTDPHERKFQNGPRVSRPDPLSSHQEYGERPASRVSGTITIMRDSEEPKKWKNSISTPSKSASNVFMPSQPDVGYNGSYQVNKVISLTSTSPRQMNTPGIHGTKTYRKNEESRYDFGRRNDNSWLGPEEPREIAVLPHPIRSTSVDPSSAHSLRKVEAWLVDTPTAVSGGFGVERKKKNHRPHRHRNTTSDIPNPETIYNTNTLTVRQFGQPMGDMNTYRQPERNKRRSLGLVDGIPTVFNPTVDTNTINQPPILRPRTPSMTNVSTSNADTKYTSVMWCRLVDLWSNLLNEERNFWKAQLEQLAMQRNDTFETDPAMLLELLDQANQKHTAQTVALWKHIYESWVPNEYMLYFQEETRKSMLCLHSVVNSLFGIIEDARDQSQLKLEDGKLEELHRKIEGMGMNHGGINQLQLAGARSEKWKSCGVLGDLKPLNSSLSESKTSHLSTESWQQSRMLLKQSHSELLEQVYSIAELVGAALDADMEDSMVGATANQQTENAEPLSTLPSCGLQVAAKLQSVVLDLETRLEAVCPTSSIDSPKQPNQVSGAVPNHPAEVVSDEYIRIEHLNEPLGTTTLDKHNSDVSQTERATAQPIIITADDGMVREHTIDSATFREKNQNNAYTDDENKQVNLRRHPSDRSQDTLTTKEDRGLGELRTHITNYPWKLT